MNRLSIYRLVPALVLAAGVLAPSSPGQPLKKRGPKVGEKAPDFELKYLDSKATFKLSDNFGKRPTVLIFHSFT